MPTDAGVVQQLVNLRKRLGMSQTQLAELIGTVQSAISELENGGNPTIATVTKIADVLGVKVRVVEPLDLEAIRKRAAEAASDTGAAFAADFVASHDVPELLAEVERLRNEAKAIITEYDRVVAENAELHQEILRLKAGHADLAAMHADLAAMHAEALANPLIIGMQDGRLVLAKRRAEAELAVIEAARAWRRVLAEIASDEGGPDDDWDGPKHMDAAHALTAAVDALPQPTAGADAEATWCCSRCGATLWVAASLTGPVSHGGRAIKQCVPCGWYSNEPAGADPHMTVRRAEETSDA